LELRRVAEERCAMSVQTTKLTGLVKELRISSYCGSISIWPPRCPPFGYLSKTLPQDPKENVISIDNCTKLLMEIGVDNSTDGCAARMISATGFLAHIPRPLPQRGKSYVSFCYREGIWVFRPLLYSTYSQQQISSSTVQLETGQHFKPMGHLSGSVYFHTGESFLFAIYLHLAAASKKQDSIWPKREIGALPDGLKTKGILNGVECLGCN
jgi:hypothetical protein